MERCLCPLPPLSFLKPGSIFLCNYYVTTFECIWTKAFQSGGSYRYFIIGQPGTSGCLLFCSTIWNITPLFYLSSYITSLSLQQKQKVLFSFGSVFCLFNDNHIYQCLNMCLLHIRHLQYNYWIDHRQGTHVAQCNQRIVLSESCWVLESHGHCQEGTHHIV